MALSMHINLQAGSLQTSSRLPVRMNDAAACLLRQILHCCLTLRMHHSFHVAWEQQQHLCHQHACEHVSANMLRLLACLLSCSEGKLTAAQRSQYRSQMRHEHQVYERLQAAQGSSNGIPTVYFAGGRSAVRWSVIAWHRNSSLPRCMVQVSSLAACNADANQC